jgi:shikimate kinase
MKIILIGYRCTGKSSVGRRLAERLKLPFYDTDGMIIDRIGKTIKAWVAEKGWESFRQEEKMVIQEIPSSGSAVVSLGGGAILDPENREIIKQKSLVVWLTADGDTILKRMKADSDNQDNRPSLSEKDWEAEIQEILAQRMPLYQQLADVTIDTKEKGIEAVAEEILERMDLESWNKTEVIRINTIKE